MKIKRKNFLWIFLFIISFFILVFLSHYLFHLSPIREHVYIIEVNENQTAIGIGIKIPLEKIETIYWRK